MFSFSNTSVTNDQPIQEDWLCDPKGKMPEDNHSLYYCKREKKTQKRQKMALVKGKAR